MEKLWRYEDFIDRLSHPESLVRTWAFGILRERFPRRFTPEISQLIGDQDEHLASAAPKYLADHKAVEFAPAILNSFLEGKGNVPGNCATALGDMHYEPALGPILDFLPHARDGNTLLGILYFLGKIHREECRETLRKIFSRMADHSYSYWEMAAQYLLRHRNPADVPLVLNVYFRRADPKARKDPSLERLMWPFRASALFSDFLEYNTADLLTSLRESISEVLKQNPIIQLDQTLEEEIIRMVKGGELKDLATTLLHDAQTKVEDRSLGTVPAEQISEILSLDHLALAFLDELSRRFTGSGREMEDDTILKNVLAALFSCYLSILERGGYVRTMGSEASLSEIMETLKLSGTELPEPIQDRLVKLSPVPELKASLTEDLSSWGDIWAVRLMGRIGDSAFVPDLVRVVKESDGLSFIHEDAVRALNGIDESGQDELLSSIREGHITDDIDMLALLEHLPYSESFDIAMKLWQDSRVDALETFGICIEGIGDERGIDLLREVYAETDAIYIGENLETLCLIHGRSIPEIPDIRREREEQRKRQEKRWQELNKLAARAGTAQGKTAGQAISGKKIGRNEPCPCGSGKK